MRIRMTVFVAVVMAVCLSAPAFSQVKSGGLRLFSDGMRQAYPSAPLDYVEDAYRAYANGVKDDSSRFEGLTFVYGSWESLAAALTDSTACTVSLINGRQYSIVWDGIAQIVFPVQYDRIIGDSRSVIEDSLIRRLKSCRVEAVCVIPDSLVAADTLVGDSLYVVKGDTYGVAQVSRDVYLMMTADSLMATVYSPEMPVATLADMFICGLDGLSVPAVITIPRHDYGVVDTLTTTVESLREVCGADGCVPFWGTESIDGDELRGTVFFYNRALGYDHVLRVVCDPRLIGAPDFCLHCRMSLFVPTNNVKNLYEVADPNAPKKAINYE